MLAPNGQDDRPVEGFSGLHENTRWRGVRHLVGRRETKSVSRSVPEQVRCAPAPNACGAGLIYRDRARVRASQAQAPDTGGQEHMMRLPHAAVRASRVQWRTGLPRDVPTPAPDSGILGRDLRTRVAFAESEDACGQPTI